MIKKLFLLAVVIMTSNQAHSALLNVVDDELIGADDVLVNGSLYDVIFRDGTCVLLFSGCDEASDFTFQTGPEANAASQALVDQVFGGDDIFDREPGATKGIDIGPKGLILTVIYVPHIIEPEIYGDVIFGIARNMGYFDWQWVEEREEDHVDCGVLGCIMSGDFANLDSTFQSGFTYAQWTPITSVPEPGTLALLSIGLAGMGIARRRKA